MNMNIDDYVQKTGKTSINVDEMYKCDECHETFRAGDVLLKEAPSNIEIVPHPMMGGLLTAEYEGKKYYTHCPKCQHVHLFGFNKAK